MFEELQKKIGHNFAKEALLDRALTRKAYANEAKQQNPSCEDQEVFRTLGDAVLKAALVDLLINNGCKTPEEITVRKEELECEERLANISREFGIDQAVKLGLGEKKQKANKKQSVLAETLEALIGAIYRDGGYDTAKNVIRKWYKL